MNEDTTVPVLIVGGSLVGLSAAMFLLDLNIPVIVVEKHDGSMKHPRAIGYTLRTMEYFRLLKIVNKIPQTPDSFRLGRAKVESLAGKWQEVSYWSSNQEEERSRYSPCNGATIAQDNLEPMLRSRAMELGADIRQNTEFLSYDEYDECIVVKMKDRLTGKYYQIKTKYLIAADGNRTVFRDLLDVKSKGCGFIKRTKSVLFKCSQADALLKDNVFQFEIKQENFQGFLTTYNDGRWVLFLDDKEYTTEMLKECIENAIGISGLEFEIITTGSWDLSATVCDYFSKGNIFLAGDAAHTLPPNRGGFGANTGISDVYNLAWKLKCVLNGQSSSKLLDSYNSERQPIAWLRHQQIFARPDYAKYNSEIAKNEPVLDDIALELGELVQSNAVIGDLGDSPLAIHPKDWAGRPGIRAPHTWVIKDGKEVSTIDLFYRDFKLLSQNIIWSQAVTFVNEKLRLDIDFIDVSTLKFLGNVTFEDLFSIRKPGAILIRPDGVVAWKTEEMQENIEETLLEVMRKILYFESQ
ncbi:uncharacterized protein PRCAT00001406001 [Priceomyces carsonii]|uniref:uncharacterized protein n=1 Tax=Priceomyces carsonii TaxID=28549 RepID=UPI002ED79053|nr:unnamed protein product [Priceomyces carsonii]